MHGVGKSGRLGSPLLSAIDRSSCNALSIAEGVCPSHVPSRFFAIFTPPRWSPGRSERHDPCEIRAQLTTEIRGRLFRRVIGDPFGPDGPLRYGYVHYVVKYKPCGMKAGLDYYFDAYTWPRFDVLDPESEIQ